MLSISRIGSPGGAAAYYSKEDYAPGATMDVASADAISEIESADGVVAYYTVPEDELGTPLHWDGRGADLLDLDGPADEEAFKAVLYGINPDGDGEVLSKREGRLRKNADAPDQDMEAPVGAESSDANEKQEAGSKAGETWRDLSLSDRIALAEASGEKHTAGWDLTFSAPKAVSILALDSVGDDRLVVAHVAAVDVALDYIEKHLSVYRMRNEDGARREEISGNLLMARTTHSLSRSGDPNLHDHVIVLNATRDQEGIWRALESEHIYKHMRLAGAIYQAELRNLVQELGYDVKDGETLNTFTLAAVPFDVVQAHSLRRQQIQANIQDMEVSKGRPLTDAEREAAVLRDRPVKSRQTVSELREQWATKNTMIDFGVDGVVSAALSGRKGRDCSFSRASPFLEALEAVGDFFRGESAVFERPEKALGYGQEAAFHATTVATQHEILFRAMIANGNRLRVSDYIGTGFFDRAEFLRADRKVLAGVSTRETIDREKGINAHIISQEGKGFGYDPAAVTASLLAFTRPDNSRGFRLTEDQFKAVQTVLTSCDGVVALQGSAGTGKTAAFDTLQMTFAALGAMAAVQADVGKETRRIVFAAANETRVHQLRVLRGVAPTHSAVKELSGNNIAAETLSALLGRYAFAREHAPAELRKMKADYKDSWLLFDETSMMGNRQLETVFAMQNDLKIDKVILAGDIRQIAALQAGAPFKMSMDHNELMATGHLTTVMRQSANPTLKEVVIAFAAGRSGEAMRKLVPFIHEQGQNTSDEKLADKAFALWEAGGREARIVVDTNRMRGLMNARIRDALGQAGILSGPSYVQPTFKDAGVAGPDKLTTRLYEKGQMLYFFGGLGRFKPGDTVSVDTINHKRNTLKGEGRDGKIHSLDLGQRSKGRELPFGVYRRNETVFSVGERVLFNKTDKARQIKTNDEFEISGIGERSVELRAIDGKSDPVSIPRSDPQLEFMTYAYAVTADKAQGRSFQSVIGILKSTGQGDFVNAARAYIMSSRAKAEFHLVTDSFIGLLRKVTEHDGINLVGLDNLFDRQLARGRRPDKSVPDMKPAPDLSGANFNSVAQAERSNLSPDAQGSGYRRDGAMDIGDKSKAMERSQPERSM